MESEQKSKDCPTSKKSTGLCTLISWQCNKILRVVDLTLPAECLSLKECLHEAIYVRKVIEESLA